MQLIKMKVMLLLIVISLLCYVKLVWAESISVKVAVASNALEAMKAIANEFETTYSRKVLLSSGSTGKLYAQIINGAPYDVFLAANEREPERLVREGKAVAQSRFTYAYGKLVLCGRVPSGRFDSAMQMLQQADFKRLAIANPRTAPYGLAAREFLESAGIWAKLRRRIIRGENIAQAYQYFISGNTELALLAKAQFTNKTIEGITCLEAASQYYQPLRQQAVLLNRAKANTKAREFIQFLKSDKARWLLSDKFGYGVEQS